MSESGWVRVTACGNIPAREGRVATIGDQRIAIFNLGDRFLAVDDRCPHRGGPLSDGIVAGDAVVCPLHGWKVGLEDGAVRRPAAGAGCIRSYRVRVENGDVQIQLACSTGEGHAA